VTSDLEGAEVAPQAAPVLPGPAWRRAALSVFIVFHWACVLAWLWPNPSDLKSFLMGLRVPLPMARTEASGGFGVGLERRGVVTSYLFHTAQHQDWAMFAPNPLQFNRYVAATVIFRDGSREEYGFPRLSQLNVIEAWIQKRYRKYQHRIADENSPAFREDLARYIARQVSRPDRVPARVAIYDYQSPIPRHNRVRAPGWIDYTALLRDHARFNPKLLLEYAVRPEDLP
jgi:hypothetical protein